MILIKVELHSAITGKVTEIGRMQIYNDGTGTSKSRNYGVRLMRRGTKDVVQRTGEVKGHASLSLSIWKLVAKALLAVGFKP